jgi:NADH-quinone oxidoreductase subunit D
MDQIIENDLTYSRAVEALKKYAVETDDPLDNEMVLNMGPQHPATHGVLRLVLSLDGETVTNCVPVLGYLHRGYEKMAEDMNYYDYIPHTDRLDYLAPPSNNVAIVLAVEKLLGLDIPRRASYIRMVISELARIASHLVAIGAMVMDLGALTVFLWSFREREKIQELYDLIIGARFTTSYTRIGGVAGDITDEAQAGILEFLDQFPETLDDLEKLLNANKIFVQRLDGVGVISAEDAIDLGMSGPNLRASGVEHDIRRAEPYLFYNEMDFKVPTYPNGDSLARYWMRMDEMRESIKIIRQALEMMPFGDIMANSPKKAIPRKVEVYSKMEELIHDFMLTNFGTEPPAGEIYHAVENPKGEFGFHIVSRGEGHPWKMKIKSPSATNLQTLPHLVNGHMISDVVAILGSLDPVMGEADK